MICSDNLITQKIKFQCNHPSLQVVVVLKGEESWKTSKCNNQQRLQCNDDIVLIEKK